MKTLTKPDIDLIVIILSFTYLTLSSVVLVLLIARCAMTLKVKLILASFVILILMGLFLSDDRRWQVENPEGNVGTGNSLAEVRLMLKTMSDDDGIRIAFFAQTYEFNAHATPSEALPSNATRGAC